MQLNVQPCLLSVAFLAIDLPLHRQQQAAPACRIVYDFGSDVESTVAFALSRVASLGLRSRSGREPILLFKPDGDDVDSHRYGGVSGISSNNASASAAPTGPDAKPTLRGRWVLLAPVPVPAPVGAAAASSGTPLPPFVIAVVTLSGQRVRSVGGFLSFAAAAYARELALKPPPKTTDDVIPPTDHAVSALLELASNPAAAATTSTASTSSALSAASMQKTTLFGTGFASFGSVASAAMRNAASSASGGGGGDAAIDPRTAAVIDAMPHSDIPLDDVLSAFNYDQLHTVLSVLARGTASVAFVAATPTQAAQAAAGCIGLIYPLTWVGETFLGISRADEAVEATSLDAAVIVAATHDVVPALVSGPGRSRLWVADCHTGLVAPAVASSVPVELLPHSDFKLKDKWKRAISAAAESASSAAMASAQSGLGAAGSPSASGTTTSFGSRASCEAQSAVLLAACDLFVDVLGHWRKCIVPRGPESHVNLNSLLAKALGLVGSDPNPHGAALLAALVASPVVLRWSSDIARFNDVVGGGGGGGARNSSSSSPAAMGHPLYSFARRCGDKSPELYPDLASEAAKKSASSPFGAISSFVKQARTSVRSTVTSSSAVAPVGLSFVRVPGRRSDARTSAANLASNASSNANVEAGSATTLIVKSQMRAGVTACKPLGLADLPRSLPATERAFVGYYQDRGDDVCPTLHHASSSSSSAAGGGAASRAQRKLSWDTLGHFADFHLIVAPPACRADAAHIEAFRTAVTPSVASGSFAVVAAVSPGGGPAASPTTTTTGGGARGGFRIAGARSPAASAATVTSQQQQQRAPAATAASSAPRQGGAFSFNKPAAAAAASTRLRGVLDLTHMLGGSQGSSSGGGPASPQQQQPQPEKGGPPHEHLDPFDDCDASISPAPAPAAAVTSPSDPNANAFFSKPPTRPVGGGGVGGGGGPTPPLAARAQPAPTTTTPPPKQTIDDFFA